MNPYLGRNAPTLQRLTPKATRRPDLPRGFPAVGNGLGGLPVRRFEPPDAWTLTVDIDAGGQDWTVDIEAGTGIAITVDWGDGLIEPFSTTGDKTHVYSAPGRYYPKITGSFASAGNIRLGSVAGNRARLKATSVIPFIPGLANFHSTFFGCNGLTAIPVDLFRYNTLVSTNGFYQTFFACTGLTAIPVDLFRYNTLVSTSGFYQTFHTCSGLTAIPVDLFRYNTLVSTNGFRQTFQYCTGLTTLPVDLFRYSVNVSTFGFYATFFGCTKLTAIPVDLFRYNTAVSTTGFYATFQNCTGLTAIPTDLFRYSVNVSTSGFQLTFGGCTNLATVPALLFKYNTACTSFQSVFQNCNQLQLRADLFFDTGEEGTRFLNQSVNFTDAMSIGTFTGAQGTAPALWDCAFGTGTPTTTTCFTGQTTSSVTNHAAIPTAWGGPA